MLRTSSIAEGTRDGTASTIRHPDQKPPANGEPLSKRLEKKEGVLKPPSGVDPKIHKEPPGGTGDRMPVIVPPGEPGGNQNIQPK